MFAKPHKLIQAQKQPQKISRQCRSTYAHALYIVQAEIVDYGHLDLIKSENNDAKRYATQ
jgi:hypothetical protein